MKALIGNSLIPKIIIKDKQYEIRDTKLNGFLIRINPGGSMNYVCQYKRGGRINLGAVGVISPAQARDQALSILADAAKGIDPLNKRINKKLLLKEFIETEYAPWVITHRKVGEKTLDHIRRCFIEPFGNKLLTELNPSLIDQWRTQRLKKGVSVETVNRDVATFKAAISKAVLWGIIDSNPLERLKLLKTDRSPKIRFLTEEEELALRNTAINREERIRTERDKANQWRQERGYELFTDLRSVEFADYLRPMILVSINTGLRRGELFSLTWNNISFQNSLLTIEGNNSKSGKTRHVPLNSEALKALKAWRKQTDHIGLVFPSKNGARFDTIKKSWAALLKEANITNFRWHDLRHHFASKLVMAGVDLNTVRELLGHAEMTMTLRYAHLAPEHKANAVEKLVRLISQGNIDERNHERQPGKFNRQILSTTAK